MFTKYSDLWIFYLGHEIRPNITFFFCESFINCIVIITSVMYGNNRIGPSRGPWIKSSHLLLLQNCGLKVTGFDLDGIENCQLFNLVSFLPFGHYPNTEYGEFCRMWPNLTQCTPFFAKKGVHSSPDKLSSARLTLRVNSQPGGQAISSIAFKISELEGFKECNDVILPILEVNRLTSRFRRILTE